MRYGLARMGSSGSISNFGGRVTGERLSHAAAAVVCHGSHSNPFLTSVFAEGSRFDVQVVWLPELTPRSGEIGSDTTRPLNDSSTANLLSLRKYERAGFLNLRALISRRKYRFEYYIPPLQLPCPKCATCGT